MLQELWLLTMSVDTEHEGRRKDRDRIAYDDQVNVNRSGACNIWLHRPGSGALLAENLRLGYENRFCLPHLPFASFRVRKSAEDYTPMDGHSSTNLSILTQNDWIQAQFFRSDFQYSGLNET